MEMNEYRELLQFSLYVGSKKVVKRHKKLDNRCIMAIWNRTNYDPTCPVGIKKCSFDEYVELIRTGHTIKRIPKIDGVLIPTRFLFIDFDNEDGENITEKEIRSLESDKVKILPSSSWTEDSNKPCYKWHAYLYSERNIWNVQELKEATKEFVKKLEAVCERKITYDERVSSSLYQVCYGRPQPTYELDIPDGVERFSPQLTVKNDFRARTILPEELQCHKEQKSENGEVLNIVPYNSRMLLRELQNRYKEEIFELHDKSFSISPPYTFRNKLMSKGSMNWRIPVGKRYFTGQCWAKKLAAQWYKCNLKYNVGYTYEDLEYTLTRLCKTNFDMYEEFDMTNVLKSLSDDVKKYEKMPYELIESVAEGQIRWYREQAMTINLVLKLKDELLTDAEDPDTMIVTFMDRRSMLDALKKYHLTEYIFKKCMNTMGFEVEILRRSQKRSKIDFNKYPQNENGQYLIPIEEITPHLRNKASKLRLSIKCIKSKIEEQEDIKENEETPQNTKIEENQEPEIKEEDFSFEMIEKQIKEEETF